MKLRQILPAFALFAFSACNTGNATGYVPTTAEIQQIQIGADNRSSMQERFGPPTIIGESSNVWYYIAQQRRYPGSLPTQEVERRILAIRFEGDSVAGVTEFGEEIGRDVPISRYTTETGGRELTLWDQMLGSIGNMSAESFLSSLNNEY